MYLSQRIELVIHCLRVLNVLVGVIGRSSILIWRCCATVEEPEHGHELYIKMTINVEVESSQMIDVLSSDVVHV